MWTPNWAVAVWTVVDDDDDHELHGNCPLMDARFHEELTVAAHDGTKNGQLLLGLAVVP